MGLALGACRSSPGPPLPAEATEVMVAMTEYRFDYERPIPEGAVVFRVDNAGTVDHELYLVEIPKNLETSLEEQLRSAERRVVLPIASSPLRSPGQGTVFAVDLTPGRYGLICFVKDPDGKQHFQKGMNSEFRVGFVS